MNFLLSGALLRCCGDVTVELRSHGDSMRFPDAYYTPAHTVREASLNLASTICQLKVKYMNQTWEINTRNYFFLFEL